MFRCKFQTIDFVANLRERLFQELTKEKSHHDRLKVENQKAALELADTKSQVQLGNYKIENYDKMKRWAVKYRHLHCCSLTRPSESNDTAVLSGSETPLTPS